MSEEQSIRNVFQEIEKQESIARQFGFYWESLDQLIDQIQSECQEVQEAWQVGDRLHLQEEVGDLLQAAVSLAIFCGLDPQITLSQSVDKFQSRYDRLVTLAKADGRANLQGESTDVLLEYWKRAK